mmetsp:Transcript_32376/g.76146  ORF Transcript_32376/g.76146 Transcript_32376/m.76146 type:complete len:303 (+) Transcript_32376:2938-3846(+)
MPVQAGTLVLRIPVVPPGIVRPGPVDLLPVAPADVRHGESGFLGLARIHRDPEWIPEAVGKDLRAQSALRGVFRDHSPRVRAAVAAVPVPDKGIVARNAAVVVEPNDAPVCVVQGLDRVVVASVPGGDVELAVVSKGEGPAVVVLFGGGCPPPDDLCGGLVELECLGVHAEALDNVVGRDIHSLEATLSVTRVEHIDPQVFFKVGMGDCRLESPLSVGAKLLVVQPEVQNRHDLIGFIGILGDVDSPRIGRQNEHGLSVVPRVAGKDSADRRFPDHNFSDKPKWERGCHERQQPRPKRKQSA